MPKFYGDHGQFFSERVGLYDLNSQEEAERRGYINTFTEHGQNYAASELDQLEIGLNGYQLMQSEPKAHRTELPKPTLVTVSMRDCLITNSPDVANYIFNNPQEREAFLKALRERIAGHVIAQANPDKLTVTLDLTVPEIKLTGSEQLFPNQTETK